MKMEYTKVYTVNDAHIDIQGIMDGLYYPFYLEYCRHDFIREVLGLDFKEQAAQGVYMVLSGYRISFLRSLKKDDRFSVSCVVFSDAAGQPKVHFDQSIHCNGKLMTRAVFTGTCIPAKGGRPYLPDDILRQTADLQKVGNKL
jgi:acyl-CoA thioester hydrolase